MRKLLLAFAFIFLFVLSVWALNNGQNETYTLAAGEVLTVTAPPGATGLAVRLSRTPGGGDAQSVTAIAGANLTFGPYAQTERFEISVTAGSVTVAMAPPTPYTTSIADGDTSHSPDANATFTTADINGGTMVN